MYFKIGQNEIFAQKAQQIWLKIKEIVGLHYLKLSNQGRGKKEFMKSYGQLFQSSRDLLLSMLLKLLWNFFKKLNGFLSRFQTDSPMVPFLVNAQEDSEEFL